ncbi:MAG TPA: hypothetical protein VGJ77_16340 [Gaiellaceae bacterium]
MSARTWGTAETVAGILAAAAMFVGFLELAYRPFRLAPAALLVALVAAVMSRQQQRLVGLAVAVILVCFLVGASIAVWLSRPLY